MGGPAGGLEAAAGRVLDTVEATIRRHGMLAGGETVVVAVSGGSDSMALLYLLRHLAAAWGLALRVLHVDHRLRPDSSRDGELVGRMSARLGVPAEVVAVAVAPEGSREVAARNARYRALEEYANRIGAHRIAVAHTADDQAETVLMRLLEGTGVRGLAGIPATRGRIIRPLLAERRNTLRALLIRAGIEWVEDPSNGDRRFLRNRIRHELLPMLQETYNPEIVAALVRVSGLARTTANALESAAARELERLACVGLGELVLPLADLRALPGEIAAEVLRLGAAQLGSRASLRAWAHRGLGRALALPAPRRALAIGGVTIEVSVGRLRLGSGPAGALGTWDVPVPGCLALAEAGLVLESALRPRDESPILQDPWRVIFDADTLPGPLIVRRRRHGDRMTPFGATAERRVKRILMEAKVPRWERERVPIVQAGADIAWVGGVRRAAMAPVTATTRRVLQLSLSPLAGVRRPG